MNVSFVFIVEGKQDKNRLPLLLEKYYSEAINEFRNKINSAFASSANISILETKNNYDINFESFSVNWYKFT